MNFIQSLKIEYPIPEEFSIWGGNNVVTNPVEDLNVLIDTCVRELASDILITAYIEAGGMTTYMPEGTVSVVSAMLSSTFPFQGNRLLKVTYDKAANVAYLRYYPATITYQRLLNREDLDNLVGDQLIYAKSYVLYKMSQKELTVLKSVNMSVDNGTIDLSDLQTFKDNMKNTYDILKPEILLYNTVY